QAALESETVHALEHACFLGAALLYWSTIVGSARRAGGSGVEAASVFGTAFHGALLGALMTIAPTVWYPEYARRGPGALPDQQLAGLWMWVPAGLVFVVCGMALVAGWLRESARRAGEAS
ncbi:MAG TPA: cytochrome c oxidase assembly protein, partial [Thermoanaerobaculia bacterium]|nr:cytochrome c oxidase assembly protein [Thermoanaerobaculia bacterium]